MEMTFQEMYTVHNNMMAIAHRELQESGFNEAAEILQKTAQDRNGSIALHQLIKTVMDLMELDKVTEQPKES